MSCSSLTRKNVADRSGGNIVTISDFEPFKNTSEGSNLVNLLVGELSVSNVPALLDHISNVVRVGSEKQVIRSYAWRIVAGMENVNLIGNRPEVDHPRNTVGKFVTLTSFSNSAISLRELSAPKEPTGIALNDSTPKAFENGGRKSLRNQIRETINWFRHFSLSCIERLTRLGVRFGCSTDRTLLLFYSKLTNNQRKLNYACT